MKIKQRYNLQKQKRYSDMTSSKFVLRMQMALLKYQYKQMPTVQVHERFVTRKNEDAGP
jgi:hypothetical protein